jgi:hypothetical protein
LENGFPLAWFQISKIGLTSKLCLTVHPDSKFAGITEREGLAAPACAMLADPNWGASDESTAGIIVPFIFYPLPLTRASPELRRGCFDTPLLVREVRFAPSHPGIKNAPLSRGH